MSKDLTHSLCLEIAKLIRDRAAMAKKVSDNKGTQDEKTCYKIILERLDAQIQHKQALLCDMRSKRTHVPAPKAAPRAPPKKTTAAGPSNRGRGRGRGRGVVPKIESTSYLHGPNCHHH